MSADKTFFTVNAINFAQFLLSLMFVKTLIDFQQLRILGLSSTRISNKLLLNGTLNHCKVLSKLNLSRTRVSNKRLSSLVLPLLSQLNLDWTRVTSDCLTLLTGRN